MRAIRKALAPYFIDMALLAAIVALAYWCANKKLTPQRHAPRRIAARRHATHRNVISQREKINAETHL
jgi:hypothetical protein